MDNRSYPSCTLDAHGVPPWDFPPCILFQPSGRHLGGREGHRPLTGAHGRVVAGSVLAQGSGALGVEGGGGAETAAALPALPAADGARAPGGPLIHLSICG